MDKTSEYKQHQFENEQIAFTGTQWMNQDELV